MRSSGFSEDTSAHVLPQSRLSISNNVSHGPIRFQAHLGCSLYFSHYGFFFFHCFVAVVPPEMNNQTDVTEFIFLGFSNHPNLQSLFFLVFLVIYLTTLFGNTLIIMATRVSPALHIPMYYFLSNLSFLDICYSSTTIPGMLVNFFQEKKAISYEGCLSQIFFLVTCAALRVYCWQLWLTTAM